MKTTPDDIRTKTPRTDRSAERKHKVVVGIAVGVVAVIAIAAIASNAHRYSIARNGATVPAATTDQLTPPGEAPPDTQAPTTNAAPGEPIVPAGDAASQDSPSQQSAPPSDAPQSDGASPPSAGARPTSDMGSPGAAGFPLIDTVLRRSPSGEAAVTTSGRFEVDARATTTAFGNGRLANDPGVEPASAERVRAVGGDAADVDRQITGAVQSQLASDSLTQRAALAVTTIDGVVILTGTAPNAGVVEHLKQVVQQVRDVRGVDATAVKVSSI